MDGRWSIFVEHKRGQPSSFTPTGLLGSTAAQHLSNVGGLEHPSNSYCNSCKHCKQRTTDTSWLSTPEEKAMCKATAEIPSASRSWQEFFMVNWYDFLSAPLPFSHYLKSHSSWHHSFIFTSGFIKHTLVKIYWGYFGHESLVKIDITSEARL